MIITCLRTIMYSHWVTGSSTGAPYLGSMEMGAVWKWAHLLQKPLNQKEGLSAAGNDSAKPRLLLYVDFKLSKCGNEYNPHSHIY